MGDHDPWRHAVPISADVGASLPAAEGGTPHGEALGVLPRDLHAHERVLEVSTSPEGEDVRRSAVRRFEIF